LKRAGERDRRVGAAGGVRCIKAQRAVRGVRQWVRVVRGGEVRCEVLPAAAKVVVRRKGKMKRSEVCVQMKKARVKAVRGMHGVCAIARGVACAGKEGIARVGGE